MSLGIFRCKASKGFSPQGRLFSYRSCLWCLFMSEFKALSLKVRSAFYASSIHVTAQGIELKGYDLGALMHRSFNVPLNTIYTKRFVLEFLKEEASSITCTIHNSAMNLKQNTWRGCCEILPTFLSLESHQGRIISYATVTWRPKWIFSLLLPQRNVSNNTAVAKHETWIYWHHFMNKERPVEQHIKEGQQWNW